MKKSFLVSIFSFIALIFISNCGDNVTNPSSNNEIWPLKVGNYWKFDAFFYDTLGNILNKETIIYKIVSDTLINNEKFYTMIIFKSNDTLSRLLFTKRTDGIYSYREKSIVLILKYPVSIGEKFNSYFNSLEEIMVFEKTNNNIATTLGNFSCFHYSILSNYWKQNIFFKNGVGYVASNGYKKTESDKEFIIYKMLLKEYKVN